MRYGWIALLALVVGCAPMPPPRKIAVAPPPAPSPPRQTGPVAGSAYSVLPGKVQTTSGEQVEVVEFFRYGCDHCYQFEPTLRGWERGLPENVVLRRIPVEFAEAGERYARIYYTAQVLGVLDKIHPAAFKAIQRRTTPLETTAQVRAFFVAHGVDGADFDRTFTSPAVDIELNHGILLVQLYNVLSVPSIGVDGLYLVSAQQSGTYLQFVRSVNFLVNTQRATR